MTVYEAYLKSSASWMKEAPTHWETKRLKEILSERKESNNPVKTSDILSLTNTRGVIPYAQKGNVGNKSKEKIEDYKLAYPDDLVINSMNVIIGSVGLSKYFGAVSPVYYMLYPRHDDNIKYYEYIFKLPTLQEYLKGLGNGILAIRMRIPMIKLNNVLLPVPPREEQDHIVRYLDWQVSKTNALISMLKKQISLLVEQKQSIINHVVTKGLDHTVPMKDSGVSWIGKIPQNWDTTKIRRFCSLQNGISESGSFFEHGTPFVSYGDVYKHYTLAETVAGVAASSPEQQQNFSVLAGDIFFTRTSETINEVGMSAVCAKTIDNAVFSGFLIRVRPYKNILSLAYLKYYLKFSGIQQYFAQTMNIVIRASLGQNLLKELSVLVPPEEQQKNIADYLDIKCMKIDTLIAHINKQIQTLVEYRTRLISDVVTGQIDVRGIEVPDFEYVADEVDETSDEEESSNVEGTEDE